MPDTQSGRNTRDFMVYRLAGLATTVIRVVDNRQTGLDPDTQSVDTATTFSQRHRKTHHKPRTTINNHRHFRLKRPAVYRMTSALKLWPSPIQTSFGFKANHVSHKAAAIYKPPRFPAALLHNQRQLVPNAPHHTQVRHIIIEHIFPLPPTANGGVRQLWRGRVL